MKHTLLFILFVLSSFTHLTAHNGSINGQILESDSRLEVAGAIVLLEPGQVVTSSNALGFFSFNNLPVGEYKLTVRVFGFEEKQIPGIQVRDGESTTLKIEMQPVLLQLKDIEVRTALVPAMKSIGAFDIQMRPVNSAQDVLRMVPGLFIAQHAGGGKAEQIFLRGFDIDHGTDLALSVDGVPVNMVSHAHGQGYADLHFLIPETIENVTYNKGPYQADQGNFATAGSVRFATMDALDRSFIKLEAGQFNSARIVGAFDLLGSALAGRKNQHAYLAAEANYSDGYFEQPQGFRRFNALGKFSALLEDQQSISIALSAFQSGWDASGQIPERAVRSGLIGRFGSIDPTEGGQTSRYQVNLEHVKSFSNNATFKNQVYAAAYSFDLYSNFTFFLQDPVNGDQIHQGERRNLLGYEGVFSHQSHWNRVRSHAEAGLFFRNDGIRQLELSRVRQRSLITRRLSLGEVDETNAGAFLSENLLFFDRFSVQAALRYDHFLFAYEDALDSVYLRHRASDGALSPKINLKADLSKRLSVYVSGGYGYHSNDSRVSAVERGQNVLPQAFGADLGAVFTPVGSTWINLAAWYLALENELVYVGDEAIVEPSGRTGRYGLDLSARFQWLRSLYGDLDVTYSHGRLRDTPESENRIPLAPVWTATGGLSWQPVKGFFSRLRFRHLGERPANEGNSLRAEGYFLLDGALGWKAKNWSLELNVQNLTNQEWKEAQFETGSRLQNELEPVTEIHFTPGSPFFMKAGFSCFF